MHTKCSATLSQQGNKQNVENGTQPPHKYRPKSTLNGGSKHKATGQATGHHIVKQATPETWYTLYQFQQIVVVRFWRQGKMNQRRNARSNDFKCARAAARVSEQKGQRKYPGQVDSRQTQSQNNQARGHRAQGSQSGWHPLHKGQQRNRDME